MVTRCVYSSSSRETIKNNAQFCKGCSIWGHQRWTPSKHQHISNCIYTNKNRDYCVILDLSFNMRQDKAGILSLSDTTTKLVPPESIIQLGSSLKYITTTIAKQCNLNTPLKFFKINRLDRLWKLMLSPGDTWNGYYMTSPLEGKQVK